MFVIDPYADYTDAEMQALIDARREEEARTAYFEDERPEASSRKEL